MTPDEQRIVDWLRDDASQTAEELARLHAMQTLDFKQTFEWETLISLKTGIANAIQSGAHRKDVP